ncbi:hypothetical protein PG985_005252 [Apiospora marii]|uniref:Uncharacterized protein n=1 Tax=Apiospora marii TaxID=335849 RepID=A0ABR1SCR4_9PEZI
MGDGKTRTLLDPEIYASADKAAFPPLPCNDRELASHFPLWQLSFLLEEFPQRGRRVFDSKARERRPECVEPQRAAEASVKHGGEGDESNAHCNQPLLLIGIWNGIGHCGGAEGSGIGDAVPAPAEANLDVIWNISI